ncbi:sugar-binding domain-containing protein [Bacteroides sp. 519]|uniref:sugar-binding domain-containing protein n=1 Tax=Bacteroides sp. 519 TaxID=2302937 RepID=UPI0013D248C8|nr:sugar-binding domain-containing protein [Bacteroides sp. 519]
MIEKMKLYAASLLFVCIAHVANAQTSKVIDLSGYWELRVGDEKLFNNCIVLPATLDEAHIGTKQESGSTMRLLRNYTFEGKAYYRKSITIPAHWSGQCIELLLERSKVTTVWVNDTKIGTSRNIASPQQYDLTPYLTPGEHQITVLVDNGADCGLPEVVRSSHQWSDETQTNWNGIVGEISLTARPVVHIAAVRAYPDVAKRAFDLKVTIRNTTETAVTLPLLVDAYLFNSEKNHVPPAKQEPLTIQPGTNEYTIHYSLNSDAFIWSEFTPNLYRLNLSLGNNHHTLTAGLRDFRTKGQAFTINGLRTFLRGNHDGCIFPLTGYAPMDVASWMKYFDILKAWGFNHVRFHSWCPPKAAFEAADLKGFYLQPELPIWGGVEANADAPVNAFLIEQGKALMDHFGNHASFVLFATGNELWGSVEGMKGITQTLRDYDNRHLYALGSNFNLGWLGEQGMEDFIVSCRVGPYKDETYGSHVRSSFSFADAIDGGLLNATYPNTTMNFDTGVAQTVKPVIAHETGQFQVYPNARELKKYTGVLRPYNLEQFLERATIKHGYDKVERFFQASGALSLLCDKADMEMMLRTENMAGYQMLSLQDFPGQGTALVGMLDAFMDNKGITTPETFRQFNDEVVPLWEADTYTYYTNEPLRGTVKLFNYAARPLGNAAVDFTLTDLNGNVLKQGTVTSQRETPRGLAEMGTVEVDLSDITSPQALRFTLSVRDTRYRNSYNVWVYPAKQPKTPKVKIYTEVNEELLRALARGQKALLIPTADTYPGQTVGGLFTNDYWNFSMFKSISENNKKPVSPGTLGYLINDEHPLFDLFPTASHSDWQWWAPAKNARPLIMDALTTEVEMIVEAIDNTERNHHLGVMFECKVGKGKLLVCMADLVKGSEYKECKQLLHALSVYVNSNAFNPLHTISPNELSALFNRTISGPAIEGVKNVSY